jgi:hypothetical protein
MSIVVDMEDLIMTFIEQDCTITHEGREFTAGGAAITNDRITAYLGENGVVTDWHGNAIGTYVIASSWPIHSYISSKMYAIHATVERKLYKGRGCGAGMSFNGKLAK